MTARVLVVDDLELVRQLLERKLRDEYYEVVTADSGQSALDIVTLDPPDLIILDIVMPEMDGFEVCRRLKSDPNTAHIPVLMMTGVDGPAERGPGLEAGADDFLVKPIVDLELQARVRSLLRLKFTLDELRSRSLTDLVFTNAVGATPCPDRQIKVSLLAVSGEAEGFEQQLSHLGHVTRYNATDTFERLTQHDTDVVVVHLGSYPQYGLQAIARLRSMRETRGIAILAANESGDVRPLAKAFELGVGDCLKLPTDDSEIRARLRSLWRRKCVTDKLRENMHLSMQLAVTDAVTGLYNRHYLESHLRTLEVRARSSRRLFALAMIDIDHFKSVNDRWGHAVGDQVLRQFAERISRNVRGIDLAARYGGEEFVILMPDTDLTTATNIARRLNEVTYAEVFHLSGGEQVKISASIGIAALESFEEDCLTVLERADMALYEAKQNGRNCVIAKGEGHSGPGVSKVSLFR
ncbi:MAG: PleD family two-component system response regulator [Sphingomonadales bacterium]|nr:MAG: PleD family two-component system response regulator [Sphingomonadales bacterium]